MSSIILSEYFPKKINFKPKTRLDLIPKYIMMMLCKDYLNNVDRIILSIACNPLGRELSEDEIEQSRQYSMESIKEEKYWEEYDYRDDIDFKYGDEDFSLLENIKEKKYWKDYDNQDDINFNYKDYLD